jgi:hypothetical protein
LILAVLALAMWGLVGMAQEIVGTLSNFDVHNGDDQRYDDLELHILGEIDTDCILDWYDGWGAPPEILPGSMLGPGITVRWSEPNDPIEYCRTEHFGLVIDPKCVGPFTVCAFWSQGGDPVAEIPVPWQFWEAGDGAVRDIIRFPDACRIGPLLVEREYVALPEEIPLKLLMWDDVETYVREMRRRWRTADRSPRLLEPGGELVLDIPVGEEDRAVVVRYTVRLEEDPERVVSRFVNEAILSPIGPCRGDLPDPELAFVGTQVYLPPSGVPHTRYKLTVLNASDFPDSLFAAAPDLPPCGLNPNASRTWVSIYSDDGSGLYGFCALSDNDQLDDLWFAVSEDEAPPECVYVELWDRRCDIRYRSDCIPVGGDCVDFEDPLPSATYYVGDVFPDSGALIFVEPFQWGNSVWTDTGFAGIDTDGLSGGMGQDLVVNNVNVRIDFPVLPGEVVFQFGEYGGNLNIEINGDFRNFADFSDIDGATIGGVDVSVVGGLGDDRGAVRLKGTIYAFAVGGQELWIDNVCVFEAPPPVATGLWIMPWGVGGTRLDAIEPTGLTDYTDSASGYLMEDAPFGGRLGFRIGTAAAIPTPDIYYYRLQYRHESEAIWHDFSHPISVHYVKERTGLPPLFPLYGLGPHVIDGVNLYRFRPHEAELPLLVPVGPGETVRWPTTGFFGDIYSGILDTASLHLAAGVYLIRLEIYDQAGVPVPPTPGTFDFVIPIGTGASGETVTDFVDPSGPMIDGGGFVFPLAIDNRRCVAEIDTPKVRWPIAGYVEAGECGFLRYDPAVAEDALQVLLGFEASHPGGRAVFRFKLVRGHTRVDGASVGGLEVFALLAGPYAGDGFGNFFAEFSRAALLGEHCTEAAFSENLHVYAKATTGWGYRISGLDDSDVRAFALTSK